MMKTLTISRIRRPAASVGWLALLASMCLLHSPHARADMMLLATTELVAGTSAATYSFDAPGPGTVTAQLTNLSWPAPLSALNFSATTASDVLTSWSGDEGSPPQPEAFQVGSGTYFAHVGATAGGPLDLGLYSLMLKFTPAVPIPASDWMLVIGVLVLGGLARTLGAFVPLQGVGAGEAVKT